MQIAAALLLTATVLSSNVLVLRSGERIELGGAVRQENGRVIFRSASGTLYSLRAAEVDFDATTAATPPAMSVMPADVTKTLKLSESERKRLIAELEQNHSGKPAPAAPIEAAPAPASAAKQANQDEEWSWRNRASDYREAIRRARENRDLLVEKAEALRSHISSLLSLGYKPHQFTYDTTMLQNTLEQIPYADLEVTRAERAYSQFQEEARQRGVLPGWVR
jgi:hypothetical protein